MQKTRKVPKSAKDILMSSNFLERITESSKHISREFQDYGIRLSHKLNDKKHKALYIRLAKEVPRQYIESAATFAIDYPKVDNKGRIFMWKLSQICKEAEFKMSFRKKKKKVKEKKKTNQIEMF